MFMLFYLSFLVFTFFEKKRKLFLLIFFNIFFMNTYILLPNRSFQISDLYGNILGVLISLILFLCFSYVKKNLKFFNFIFFIQYVTLK